MLSLFYHLCSAKGVAFPPLRSVLLSVKCEAEIHRLEVLCRTFTPPSQPEIKKKKKILELKQLNLFLGRNAASAISTAGHVENSFSFL